MTNVSQEQKPTTGANTGCEIMYLSLRLPARLAARSQQVQLGVVLEPIDNPIGVKINQCVCRIVRAVEERRADGSKEASLNELNRLLSGEQ
jgi:hypothetical protein